VSPDGAGSDPREVGRLIALRYLEARPRTRGEVRRQLVERGIPELIADEIADRFAEVGLIDDLEYARVWVESRMRGRGLGPAALRQELRRHRVPDEIVDEVLGATDSDDELAGVVEVLRPRVARCDLPLSTRDERRLLGFALRRGHTLSRAREALAAAVAQIEGRGEPTAIARAYPG
jgi:regulatory protein